MRDRRSAKRAACDRLIPPILYVFQYPPSLHRRATSPLAIKFTCEISHMADQTPTQDSYEFALHGLLALSSTSTASNPTIVSPVDKSHVPATETRKRSNELAMDPGLIANGDAIENVSVHRTYQTSSRLREEMPLESDHRIILAGYSTLPADGIEPHGFHYTPQIRGSSHTTDPHYASPLASARPLSPIVPDATQAEHDLSLMKVYRYQIAPWVSVLK
jgi:hypothetical protein